MGSKGRTSLVPRWTTPSAALASTPTSTTIGPTTSMSPMTPSGIHSSMFGPHSGAWYYSLPRMITNALLIGLFLLLLVNLLLLRSVLVESDETGRHVTDRRSLRGAEARRQHHGTQLGGLISGLSVGGGAYGNCDGISGACRRKRTLVVYVYNAIDEEGRRNFAFFLRYGMGEEDDVTYRIVISQADGVLSFPKLPSLPENAQYLVVSECATVWGTIASVKDDLPISRHEYIVVLDASVRGPYLPSYMSIPQGEYNVHHILHWTEAFTNKISDKIKLVGAWISCEGAPRNGNAAGYWRTNPYVSPSVFAMDRFGWDLITSVPEILVCYDNLWKNRYHSESGASLAILKAGKGLDCLMTRYQGVNWTSPENWNCNERVRPDMDLHYDGISMTPYETIFTRMSDSIAAARWTSAEIVRKFEEWMDASMRSIDGNHKIQSNEWISQHWKLKAEKLVFMNTRGPDCFDFDLYIKANPDLSDISDDLLALWEHFILVGQFQDRPHAFTCPFPIGHSYRISYVLSRGLRCFDYKYYQEQYEDLAKAGITDPMDLLGHYAQFGQFEGRKVRFTCADTMANLPAGFDTPKIEEDDDQYFESWDQKPEDFSETPEEAAERLAREEEEALLRHGNASDSLQQALKGVLVGEAVKSFSKKKMTQKS